MMENDERKLRMEHVLERTAAETARQLAGLKGHALHHALTMRLKELGGMLQITSNLPEYAAMVASLCSHRQWLEKRLQELEEG